MARATGWTARNWPEGCRDPNHVGDRLDKRHFGRGLCGSCYKKRERAGTMNELEDVPSFVDPELRADLDALSDVGLDDFGPVDPVERVPGSAPPVTDLSSVPPIVDHKGVLGRLLGPKKPKTPKPPKLPKTNEREPKGRRVSTADSVEDAWIGVGGMLERAGRHAPLGRYLQWQGAGAGEVVDGVVANTYIDRKVLQPAVRARSSLDAIAAVAGPPLIILAIERSPERFTFDVDGGVNHPLLPLLASSIRSSLPTLLPAMKKAKLKKDKVDEAIRDMFPDLAPGEDVVNSVMATMFDGWFSGVEPTEKVVVTADGGTQS